MDKQFFMVYADGKSAPQFKHDTYESARTEAQRLSSKLGVKTYVLTVTEEIDEITPEMNAALQYAKANETYLASQSQLRDAFLAGIEWNNTQPDLPLATEENF